MAVAAAITHKSSRLFSHVLVKITVKISVRASSPSCLWFCSIFVSESTVACQVRVRHVLPTEHRRIVYIRETDLCGSVSVKYDVFLVPSIHVSDSGAGELLPLYRHIFTVPSRSARRQKVAG